MLQRSAIWVTVVIVVACATVEPVPIHTPKDYGSGLSAAVFSQDGNLAAVANFNTIWVFDTATLRKLMSFSGHYRFGTNNTLAFVDNDRIATTGKAGPLGTKDFHAAIWIWNIRDQFSEPLVIALPELERYAISLGYAQNTGALAIGGENGAIMLLDPDESDGYKKRQLPGLNGPVLDVVFNRDGSLLAAGGVHPEVVIWDTTTLQEVGSLPVKGNVYDLDLIPNSRSLLVASNELTLWKFLTEEELQTIESPTLAVDYLTVGIGVVITVLIAGQNLTYPTAPSHEPDYGLCERLAEASPTGAFVVDVHSGITKEKIRVIETAGSKVMRRLNPRGGQTCGLAINHDGTKLLLANNRVAQLYDTTSWKDQRLKFD